MIETEDYKAVYDADGSTVRFDFTFPVTTEGDLDVKHYNDTDETEETLNLGNDYTVEQATVGTWLDGGTVVTVATYPNDDRVSLTRDVSSTQLLDYKENDPFPAESHEGGLDKLTIMSQQLEELLSRAMLIPKSDPANLDMELVTKEARLGKFIQFDITTGEVNVVSILEDGQVTITAWGESWILLDNSSEARTEIGLPGAINYDLIIDSVADLELLNTDDAVQYPTVFIKHGTWATTDRLDFAVHGVKYLRGERPDTTISMAPPETAFPSIKLDDDGVYENFTVLFTGAAGAGNAIGLQPATTGSNNAICRDVYVYATGSGLNDWIMFGYVLGGLFNCRTFEAGIGFKECKNLSGCKAIDGSLTADGAFDACERLSNCYANNNFNGFKNCDFLTNCEVVDTVQDGFLNCDYVTGCHSDLDDVVGNAYSCFENCKYITSCFAENTSDVGFDNCSHIAACDGTNCTTAIFAGSTKQDPDSTD